MLKIGDAEIYAIKDGGFSLNQQRFFGTSAESKLVRVPVFAFLIKLKDEYILIDTGDGGYFGPLGGKIEAELSKLNVIPDQISTILLTHLHPDHIGGVALFKNAKIYTPKIDYDFWMGEKDLNYKSPEYFDFAKKIMNEVYDKLHFFHPGDKLIHNIEVIDAKGHTPGMCSFLFQNQAIFIGDLIHHLETQIKNPEKELIIDYEPKVAVESRLRLLNIISKNGWICLGSHLFPIGICKIKGDLTCYEYMTQK